MFFKIPTQNLHSDANLQPQDWGDSPLLMLRQDLT